MFTLFHIVALSSKSFNNGQKFTIVNFVSSFGRYYFSGKVVYWMPLVKIKIG